ncbi:hypothetical protein O8C83_06435 [Aliarcobacter butzleri]|uniref:hypothetical protein n=1 Tax=Aliarcobacter butzleri TaxID=28197 RepID=UPI00263C29EA|nr:hypothetical protein [Aliarcobacter butzleri]MDN5100457.1 hypothetical protein [Aliarcobacter butzleri]
MTEYFHKFRLNYMMPIIAKIILAILAIVMVPLYIKYWGVDLYKEYILIFSLIAYANIITSPMNNFMLKLKSNINKIKLYEIIFVDVILIIMIVLPFIILYLYYSYDKKYILFFSIITIILASLNGLLRNIFISIDKINLFSLFEILFSLLKLPVSFYIAHILSNSKQEYLIVFFIFYSFLFFIENLVAFLYLRIKKLFEIKIQFLYVSKKLIIYKESFIYFILVVVIEVITGTFDRLFLIKYAINDDFLIFTLALTIGVSYNLFLYPITSQSLPVFFDKKLIKEKIILVKLCYQEILFIILPTILIYLLIGNLFIDFWLRDTVSIELKNSVFEISLLLIIGVVFNSLSAPLQNLLISISKERNIMFYNVLFLFTLISSLILTYLFGNIYSFAIAFCLSYLFKLILFSKGVLNVSKR